MDNNPEMKGDHLEEKTLNEQQGEAVDKVQEETPVEAAGKLQEETPVEAADKVQQPAAAEKQLTGRKRWKKNARRVVKGHYFLLVAACLVALLVGSEFQFVQTNAQDFYNFLTGQDTGYGTVALKYNSSENSGSSESLIDILNLLSEEEETKAEAEQSTMDKVLEDLANEDEQAGQEKIDEQMQAYKDEGVTDKIAGRSGGIFADIANTISSGKLHMTIYQGIKSITHSSAAASSILVILVMLLCIFVWVFIQNVYVGILRRIFLEARIYEQVPISHVLHFKYVHRWVRAALTLLLVTIYAFLWMLTIVGYFIKRYSYFLVPYIVAENPDIKPREAIRMSRHMMNGYKWTAFKMELSFIGWHILGFITFGILDAMWTIPYSQATYAEFYAVRRALSKEAGIEGTEKLNDTYLFTKAEESLLRKTYSDIEEVKKYIDENRVTLPKVRSFIVKNFGVWVGRNTEKIKYDEVDNRRQQIREDRAVIKGKIYPQRLTPLWDDKNNLTINNIRALRTYTIWTIIMSFFVFGFVGWAYEVSIHIINDGVFINRGCLHGPWLPIYGGGVAMIVMLLNKWRSRPHLEAILIIILCGSFEYLTSYFLEMSKGMRWWDYTGYFLNLNGRICGEGLFVFCVGGMAAVYFMVPLLDNILKKINIKVLSSVCIILVMLFIADVIYSHYVPNVGEGITDYSNYKKAGALLLPDKSLTGSGGSGGFEDLNIPGLS